MTSFSNCLICATNYADPNGFYTPTFLTGPTGGAWSDAAPLSNMQLSPLAQAARSLNCVASDTQFVIDLGVPRDIAAIVLPNHNLSQSATYVFSVFSDAALTVPVPRGSYSGTISPEVYPFESTDFEESHWYDGKYTAEEFGSFSVPAMALFTPAVVGRYILVQLIDPTNPVGYLQLPRLFVSPGYQPSYNMSYGAQLVPVDPSIITRTLGGYRSVDQRTKYREFHLTIPTLPNQEAWSQVFDQTFAAGLSKQLFFSANPSDPYNLFRFSFLANLSRIDPITMSYYGYSGVAYSFIEVVA